MKEEAVAVANGFFAPFIVMDEVLKNSIESLNKRLTGDGEYDCVA